MFACKTEHGVVVNAPRKVRRTIETVDQACTACRGVHPAGSMLSALDREKLAEESRPKRRTRCSICGEVGHNRLRCRIIKSPPVANVVTDDYDSASVEDDGFDRLDYYGDDDDYNADW
jgi:hypothetical protein